MLYSGHTYVQDLKDALTALEERDGLGLGREDISRLRAVVLAHIERAEAANDPKAPQSVRDRRVPKILYR